MSVSVKRTALKKFLNNVLFEREDARYGMHDQTGPESPGDQDEQPESTVPNEVPIEPTEMMATQLADDRPPIEDEDFVPENPKELARAADQIARMIPDDQVEKFYRDMLRLYDDAAAEHNSNSNSPPVDEEMPTEEEVVEHAIRQQVRMVIEAMGRTPPGGVNWDQPRYGSSLDDEYDDEFGASSDSDQWDAGDDPEPEVGMGSDEMNLDDLATAGGYSSASGARQDIERILSRMKYLAAELPAGDIEKLQMFAVNEFIDEMAAGEYIDQEDVVDLQQAPGAVKGMDSFRFFFVAAILMPAYQEVKRTARKEVEAKIDAMGLPKKSRQTVLNQALGEVPRNQGKLAKKVARDYASENPGDKNVGAKASELAKKANAAMADLAKTAELGDNVLELAKARWGKQSKGRRQKALEQALGQTSEWQDEEAARDK